MSWTLVASRRLVAVATAVAMIGALMVLVTGFARAADPKVWVGPGCPATGWTCQAAGPVVQTSTGGPLEIHCTADDCSGMSQTNTTGSNTIVCDQQATPPAGTTQTTDQKCGGVQSNAGGNNSLDITQAATLNTPASSFLSNVAQTSGQAATSDQATTGSGRNHLDISQTATQAGVANLNVPNTAHAQEARQSAVIAKQNSVNGNQDISIDQTQGLDSTVNAPSSTQTQNTAEGDPADQLIDIGPGVDQMLTVNGVNTVDVTQTQNFNQDAAGFNGTDTLLASNQTQGSANEATPAAQLNWHVESDNFTDTDVTQTKNWTQDSSPNAILGGTKSQIQNDELGIIGKLKSTHTSTGVQGATLEQLGFNPPVTTQTRRCVQLGDVSNKVNGTLDQRCTQNDETVTQHAEGEHYKATLRCTQDGAGENCTEQSVTEVTPAEQGDPNHQYGCSDNFWKHNTSKWPAQVKTTDKFVDHFKGASPRFPTLANKTMLQAVSSSGGTNGDAEAAAKLGRYAVASLLNAEHNDVRFELHSSELRKQVNAKLATGTRSQMLALANTLASYNYGSCPLAGGACA